MDKCDTCKNNAKYGDGWSACDGCIHDRDLKDRYEVATNADRIRSMTDEELAKWIDAVDCYNCGCCVYPEKCRFEVDIDKYDCIEGRKNWLREPVGGNENE